MSTDKPGPGRSSDVLDAILGKVADNRTRTDTSNALFRAKALDQLDVAADIDNQLPLVSRRNWLLLVGAALIVVGFVIWAALTPVTQLVSGTGRVLAPSGLLSVTSPVEGFVQELLVSSGSTVSNGDVIAYVDSAGNLIPVASVVSGTTWQILDSVGESVGPGEMIVTVLPDNSDRTVLIVLPSSEADAVRPGMPVSAFGETVGAVTAVNPPLPFDEIMLRTGITVEPGSFSSIIEVGLNEPARPASEATYTIQLTNKTVLEQMFIR